MHSIAVSEHELVLSRADVQSDRITPATATADISLPSPWPILATTQQRNHWKRNWPGTFPRTRSCSSRSSRHCALNSPSIAGRALQPSQASSRLCPMN